MYARARKLHQGEGKSLAIDMASDRPEHGPNENELADRENAENRQDDNMYKVISRFLTTPEQSYESFLTGFTHLTTEDVTKYQESSTGTCTVNTSLETSGKPDSRVDPTRQSAMCPEPSVETSNGDENDLEEEVLEDLPRASIMNRPSGQPTHTLVKFDNFIEDGGGGEDAESLPDDPDLGDLLADSSYSASFLENGSGGTTLKNTRKGVPVGICHRTAERKSELFATETNFGEVEASNEYDVQESQTCLELTSVEDNPNLLNAMTLSDEVETFQLDPDFDYDNVKLTPKYSADDLKIFIQTVDV